MRRCSALIAVLTVVFVPSASAVESTIYPGVGIGKVKLGMTKAQAERFLGRDPLVNAREGSYTEFAWQFGAWTVGFQAGRAVQISISLASQRTRKGIGVGTKWRAVIRAYPGGRCAWNVNDLQNLRAMWPEYLVGHGGGSQTLYVFKPVVNGSLPAIREVVVRKTFRPLPEFAQNFPYQCEGDWRHAETPPLHAAGNP